MASNSRTSQVILVLGASGSCGRVFVDHAVHAGLSLRCLSRDPSRIIIPSFVDFTSQFVDVRQGNLANAQDVTKACEGVSAVVAMIGPPVGTPVPAPGQSELLIAMRHVVAGMRTHGVKRLIVQMGAFTKLDG